MMSPDWRASPIKRVQARMFAALGYRLVASLGSTLRWRTEGLEHFDRIVASGRVVAAEARYGGREAGWIHP